jgi:PAS domain S-box-containing protein
MGTSLEFARAGTSTTRPLPETAFEGLRDAVVVVDARPKHLPLVLANAAARRCLIGTDSGSLVDSSLYSLLGAATDSAIAAVCASPAAAKSAANRVLNWRLPRGETPIATEIKLLSPTTGQRMVMLTFTEVAAGPSLFSAIEHLPLDLLMLDSRLSVTYANAGAVRTAGEMPGGILRCSALMLVPTVAIPREVFEEALNGVHYHNDSIALTRPGSPTRWFEVDVQPLKDAAGVVGVAVLSTEVTKRRLRKRLPPEGERRLVALTEHARDIITVAGRNGRLQYISGGVRNSLGYTVEERRSNSIFEHIHPDDVDTVRSKYRQLVEGEIRPFSHPYRIRHKDGTYRWFESHYVPALDNPLIKGVVINSRDITERRHFEHELAQREEVFRLAADAVNGIIFEWDVARGTVHCSRGVHEVLGLDADELSRPDAWCARMHPQDYIAYSKITQEALGRQEPGWTTTYRIRDVRGQYRSLLERSLIQRSGDGQPLRVIGCCVDVSEIKRLTDLLAETQSAAKMGGWEYSCASREVTWTEEMYRIFETTAAEFTPTPESIRARFTPEAHQRFDAAAEAANRSNGKFDLELEIMTLRNRRLWIRVIGHFELLEGRLFRAYGSVQDIQSQKLAQMALENSTGWLKLSMNMAKMHGWRWDRSRDSLEFAILDGRMVHLPRVFPGMKKLMSRMHPRDRLAARRAIDKAFATNTEVQEEFRLKTRSGRYRSYAAVARPLFDAAHQPIGLVGVTQDVTARHESEARLRRSEELLRTTTANSADTLMLVDTDLRIRFINRGELGMSIEEIIGQSIAVLLPESARDSIIAKLRRVLATREPVTYEFHVKAIGTETQFLENRAVLVSDDGIGTGISITVRNITERKRLEREILDVSTRERQTIGRDLHDGLGQELTGVALMLRGLATRLGRHNPGVVGQVNEIVGLINQSIETARSLARGLLPVNTNSGGLTFALRALAERSRDLYGIPVEFRTDISAELGLSETNASHLYRIAQEALTNTARHSGAAAAAVSLHIADGKFSLEVADDGVGTAGMDRAVSGMGLKIMKYRASMIGAKFEIAPNRPRGTVIRVTGEQPLSTIALQSSHAT